MINVLLAVVFAGLVAMIAAVFLADAAISFALHSAEQYRWTEAEKFFRKAVALDRFDASHWAAMGNFFLSQSIYADNRIPKLLESEEAYLKASLLSPRSASYRVSLGQVRIELFLSDRVKYPQRLSLGLSDLMTACRYDPRGFNTAYHAGYSGSPFGIFWIKKGEVSFWIGCGMPCV